jgi:hypothetical protein
MTDALLDPAGEDPARARMLRESLVRLADGPDVQLREMSRAVLEGELSLRSAALGDTYGEALGRAFTVFWAHYQELEPEEREEIAAIGRAHLADDGQ